MSLRRAINAKCKDCIYDNCSPGTWREQVDECTSTDCPLYPVRPRKTPAKVQKKANLAHPEEAGLIGKETDVSGCDV